MVNLREPDDFLVSAAPFNREMLNALIEFEQCFARFVLADPGLHPKETANRFAARYIGVVMDVDRGIRIVASARLAK